MMLKVGIEKYSKRTEEDSRVKAAAANENYKIHLQSTNMIRNEFYRKYLPQFVRTMDDADDRLCLYLMKYAEIVNVARSEIDAVVSPIDRPLESFINVIASIDTRHDLEEITKDITKTAKPIDKNDREYIAYK
eukprot:jgi/Hompol1/3974/HPOL_006858-RA